MMKSLEFSDPTSCFNRALLEEVIFVVLARDPSAPAALEAWMKDRIKRGLNTVGDAQITEAIACQAAMEESQMSIRREVERRKASFTQKFRDQES